MEKSEPKEQEKTLLEMQQEIEKQRIELCAKEVTEVLQKHGFDFDLRWNIVLKPIQK